VTRSGSEAPIANNGLPDLMCLKDKKFVDASAVIDGKTIVVSSDLVAEPVAVRYGWENAAEPNLFNKEGLPASSFRTDDWPGLTYNAK